MRITWLGHRRIAPAVLALALCVLTGLLACLTPLSPAVAGRGHSVTHVDTRLTHAQCTLLGRAWSNGTGTDSAGGGDPVGCFTDQCLSASARPKQTANAEVCYVGTHAYGNPIDMRRCTALHRVWIGLMNYCASDPVRSDTAVAHAGQCRAPYTTYVLHTEAEGYYDQCLKPGRVAGLLSTATRIGSTLASLSSVRSRLLCGYRPRHDFRGGRCHQEPASAAKLPGSVLLVGDSVTWRGTNELAARRPGWDIDGIPGRHIGQADTRIDYYLRGHDRPTGFVFALGANPTSGFGYDKLVHAVNHAGNPATVMLVVPFRSNPGARASMAGYRAAEAKLADNRSNVCLADWPRVVRSHHGIMADEVHPDTAGEKVWARFVSNRWKQCVAKTSAAASGGSSSGGGLGGLPIGL